MLGRLVFAHDNPFLQAADGSVYSSRGAWPWERYLSIADRLTVVSRLAPLPPGAELTGLSAASHPQVDFVEIPSLSGPVLQFTNRREASGRLEDALTGADALVARLPSEIGDRAVRVAERLRKPWAVELVTCTWDALWNYGTWQGKVYAPISWWKTRRVVRRAPYAVYVTERFLQRRYPARGRTAGVSDVELPDLDPAVLERRLERIHARPRPFRFGIVAALGVRFKGIQTALEALAAARGRLPSFELRVLGAGDPEPWRALARRHGVEGQTFFDGTLPPGEAVLGWLDQVDLYLQPSFQEGLPRALVEALSRGCPALGSTAGGIPELLPVECLHAPGDARRLAEMVASVADDPQWLARRAAEGFETAKLYRRPVLEQRRAAFWQDFASYAQGGP